jgi:hypothetical protein
MKNILLPVLAMAFYCTQSQAQKIPLVYNVENTAATFPAPIMLSIDKLPKKCALPDPLLIFGCERSCAEIQRLEETSW